MAFEGHFGTLESLPLFCHKKNPLHPRRVALFCAIALEKFYHLIIIAALIDEQSVDYNNNRNTTNVL